MTCAVIIGAAGACAVNSKQAQRSPEPGDLGYVTQPPVHCHYCQAEVQRTDKGECVRCGAPL